MPVSDLLTTNLARTLAQLRGGHYAVAIVRALLAKPHFIGLRDGGTSGIYYDHVVHYIMTQPIPTDDNDLDPMKAHRAGKARHVTSIEQWIVDQDA